MKHRTIVSLALAAALVPSTLATVATATEEGEAKVTLCHATGSEANPYEMITVAPQVVQNAGHHTHQDGRDIIPPFTFESPNGKDVIDFPGSAPYFSEEGKAIFENGCVVPEAPVEEEPPAEEQPTPQPVTLCHVVAPGTDWEQWVVAITEDGIGHHADHPHDVIPPVGDFPGQNWDPAQFENECQPVRVTPEPPAEEEPAPEPEQPVDTEEPPVTEEPGTETPGGETPAEEQPATPEQPGTEAPAQPSTPGAVHNPGPVVKHQKVTTVENGVKVTRTVITPAPDYVQQTG